MGKIIRKNWMLITTLMVALIIRLLGTNPGYPPYHPDEPMSYSSAMNMIINGNLDPKRYDYPAGIPLVHMVFYRIFFLPIALFKLFFPHPRVFLTAIKIGNQFLAEFKEFIFGRGEFEALFFSRYVTAILGVGAVFLTYFLAKKTFNKTTGLIAAFFLAFNYRHVLSSHFALSDIPNNFFALLAVLACAFLLEKQNRSRYLLAGLTCGLFLSMKYQFFPIFTLFFVQIIWVFRRKSLKEIVNKNFILAILLIPAVFIILNPYLFLHLKKALPVILSVSQRYGMGAKQFNFYALFYLYHWGIGNLPTMVIIAGLVLGLILKPLTSLFLASFIFPFLFVFLYYAGGGVYVRNFTTVIPFLFIFAGFFFAELWRLAKKITGLHPYSLILPFVVLIFLINLEPIKNSLTLVNYYRKPWSHDELKVWLGKNFPANVQVRAHSVVDFPQDRKINRVDWPIWGENTLAEMQENGDQFAVMNVDAFHSLLYGWGNLPPRKLIQYSGVPDEFLANTFPGLAVEELLGYCVGEFFTPWQAPNINYLVFKIPLNLDTPGKKIIAFDFSNNEENWRVKGKFGKETKGFIWDENEGYSAKGSLKISQEASGFSTAHFSSPPILIKPSKYYTLSSWIKNNVNPDNRNRDGFLRMEFFKDRADAQIGQNRLGVALSARVSESNIWIKKQATAVSPEGANYVILSFQKDNLSAGFDSNLDDAVLFESDILPKENFPEIPYIKPKISEKELYPISIL